MKRLLFCCLLLTLTPVLLLAQSNFDTSLHGTREGKAHWYSAENGGFEEFTQIPMDSLPCLGCHATTYANGDTVDAATYEPGCNDCHNFSQGTAVAQTTCLGCHGRQGAEISLSANPNIGHMFTDVHRDAGMICSDCHSKKEMHGDETTYVSMNEPGATDVFCDNEGCHPAETLAENDAHKVHGDKLYCNSCHVKTVMTCYNCHFETEVEGHKKRFYGGPPMNGFVMLVNSDKHDGKVATASMQSLTYGDTSFYALGTFSGHTVSKEARDCDECHDSEIVRGYNENGTIPFVKWDETESVLKNAKGVIPIPEDYFEALDLDFVRFKGEPTDPVNNPKDATEWEFMKTGADGAHMLFASPLSDEQMQKLSTAMPSQSDFEKSLHGSRVGKTTWYEADDGFMQFTNIPMDSLPCLNCHAPTLADGTPVDAETYEPGCYDCHITVGDTPAQSVCLGCHGRQGSEISLAASTNPDVAAMFHDVHRDDYNMECSDCHSSNEMHGDGTEYASMNEPGATEVFCTTCHPEDSLPSNAEHDQHMDDIYCNACHVKSVMTCYNCHFETEVEAHKKRFYGPPPMNGFVMLINSEKHQKIATASYQSLAYGDTTFYAVGSFSGHTVTGDGRTCEDCHDTELVKGYNENGEIPVVQWDETESKLVHTKGVIPVTPNWETELKLDFVSFTGDVTDPIDKPVDTSKWTFLKSGADGAHMLYATPMTEEQMQNLATAMPSQSDFEKSLHGSRKGKETWYSKENGGFEALTNVPMDSLPCLGCHAPTLADGTPVDAETYEPSCYDCHITVSDTPEQGVCLNCHSRQGAEINLSNMNPIFSDVHRDKYDMVCVDCHTSREMHGDGNEYASMLETGATDSRCDNAECHPKDSLPDNQAHSIHNDDVYCSACHAQTVETCYNCHFETEVDGHQKRFYKQAPTGGFSMLVRREFTEGDTMVTTGSYQSLSYEGKSFYALGAFNGHTIGETAKDCDACHDNANVQAYFENNEIVVTKWNETTSEIDFTEGVIPVPPDWQSSLVLDFVDYSGEVTDPLKPFEKDQWTFLKTGADSSHMLYIRPLTDAQMQKLRMNVTSVKSEYEVVPDDFELGQNYPNPFNPGSTIEFKLPQQEKVNLKVYDILGREVMTLINGEQMKAGVHKVKFDLGNQPSGIYIYQIKSQNFTDTKKMTLLK